MRALVRVAVINQKMETKKTKMGKNVVKELISVKVVDGAGPQSWMRKKKNKQEEEKEAQTEW